MTADFRIGFVLFDNLTQLDFTGPLQVLSRLPDAELHLVSKSLDPVRSDCGPFILPTTRMSDCPQLDLICIPGGFGVDQAMLDPETIAFVKAQAKAARYVTSVCTGAFVLGAAGLLIGRRATTHWVYHADLAAVGAIPTQGRTVRDGNVFTGGGVTAGIDFALTLVAEIAGEALAQTIQLGLEYDPAPPVDSGSPGKAPAGVLKAANARYAPRLEQFRQALSGVAL